MNNLSASTGFNQEALHEAKLRLEPQTHTQDNNYTKVQRNMMIISLILLVSFSFFLGAVSVVPNIVQVAFKLL